MILEIFILAASATILYCWLNSRSRRNFPPGPSPMYPFVGNIPQLIKYNSKTTHQTFNKLAKDYGPVVLIQFGGIYMLVIHDLTLGKEILCSDVWVDRYFDDMIAERSYGKVLGIIFSFGDVWKEIRRFTMRTLRDFGFGKNSSMEGVIDEEISILCETLDKVAKTGNPLSMRQFFTVSILNVLWSMVAGVRFDHSDKRLKELINLVDETSKSNPVKAGITQAFPFLWHVTKYRYKMKRRRVFIHKLQQFFQETLEERRRTKSYKGEAKDFIDVFLQEIDYQKEKGTTPNYYTDEQFIMVAFDLFAAGAETTSNTLEFAMLYMVLNPKVQLKVQEEIDRIVGTSKRVSLLDRPKMPYTEATVLEVQRLANVLPIVFRGSNQDTKVDGYDIPKGTLVAVNAHGLHNSKQIWGDPQNFRPERFLDSDNNIINAHKILPFGLGKRVCLGEVLARASLFTYLASVLQRYTAIASPNHPTPSTKFIYGFTLSPEEYFIVLKQR